MSTLSETIPALDLTYVRAQFPSLSQTVNGHPAVFLDGPGGTQVPQRVIDAIADYLRRDNANTGGAYTTSRHTDAMIADARAAMADFFHCGADEVVFGPNMTTLTFAISRAIGRELKPGDEIVVTRLDHDANVSPWLAMGEDRGVTVRWAEIHDEDCTLDMADLASKINKNTKLVAAGYASNAVGTINPVKEIVRLAHAAGALAYVDAVHYGPHGLIDVAALDCDFLACSTYKFFGPHMGVLYGKREHLKRIRPYKVRPNTNAIPNCWEWGTLNHECIAGITACVDYIADLGHRVRPEVTTRRAAIEAAYGAIHEHERALMERLILGLQRSPAEDLRHHRSRPASTNAAARWRCESRATRRSNSPPNWASAASSPGMATTMPSTSRSTSTSKNPAASCVSASSTTTRRKKWTACLPRCARLPQRKIVLESRDRIPEVTVNKLLQQRRPS